jgi:NhaP-type Na+/H+ or K+/H+ antiporter
MLLTTVVVAVALGIAAQVVAERFQLPAILPLLALGVLCGPSGLHWFSPASLEDSLMVLVHLGVAIILFEGGLSVNPRRLARVSGPVWSLVSVGAGVTAGLAAWLAHGLIGLPWPSAVLFGAVMTVTGPTVITPLVRHMIAPQPLKTILTSEGLITDSVGAVLAYIVLQWIERASTPLGVLGGTIAELVATGALLGFAAGSLGKFVIRRRLVTGDLSNLVVFALVLSCYMIAEHQAAQSGILAVVVMGFTMSAAELPDVAPLRAFKGQLTTLFISVLFILLAGQLDLTVIADLGWRGVAVVAGVIFVARPLAVLASAWHRQLGFRERVVLALTAPRGIVAAAVASLASRDLVRSGIAGGPALEGVVYLAILATGLWATLMSLTLPVALGYTRDPSRRKVLLVGANPLTVLLARLLAQHGRSSLTLDDSSWRLDPLRRAGFQVVHGDAREAETYENAGVERDTAVVAATTNDELNLLVAQKVHDEFGVENPVIALQEPPEELGRRSRAWLDLLGGRAARLPLWLDRIENGRAQLRRLDPHHEAAVMTLREVERELPHDVLRLLSWVGGEPTFRTPPDGAPAWEGLLLLVDGGRASELLGPLTEAVDVPIAVDGGGEGFELGDRPDSQPS